ncbi:MAG: IclR family transcriptional regulator [Thermoleophilaceae bacterium]
MATGQPSTRGDGHGGEQHPPGTLGTVRNAVLLLDLLSVGPRYQQLTDLAERSGLSLPTTHRVLRSLAAPGLVEQDPESQRYGLGPELVRLSERYLARLSVVRTMAPYLVELRNTTKETILAALLMRGSTVYVDRIEGEHVGDIFRESGRIRPALATAPGRLLAARAGDAAWTEAVANGSTDGGITARDRASWAAAPHLVTIDAPDRWEAAVPITPPGGDAVAAIAATGSLERHSEEAVVELVVPQLARAAAAVSRVLSHD